MNSLLSWALYVMVQILILHGYIRAVPISRDQLYQGHPSAIRFWDNVSNCVTLYINHSCSPNQASAQKIYR